MVILGFLAIFWPIVLLLAVMACGGAFDNNGGDCHD